MGGIWGRETGADGPITILPQTSTPIEVGEEKIKAQVTAVFAVGPLGAPRGAKTHLCLAIAGPTLYS